MTGTKIARRAPSVSIAAQNMDPISLGEVLARSGFFQDSRDAAQAAVKVMAGAELGIGPVSAMTGIYIVKGRVTLSANLMAALIKAHPRYTYRVREHTDTACQIEFFEDGESIGVSEFSIGDAQRAGLAGSQTWKQHPKNMLFARALSNGAKWYAPDAFGGGPIYTPDELGAEVDGETGEVINALALAPAPAAEVLEPEPEPTITPDEAKALFAAFLATGQSREWLRGQLVACGLRDVPAAGELAKGDAMGRTLVRLTSVQAEELTVAFAECVEARALVDGANKAAAEVSL